MMSRYAQVEALRMVHNQLDLEVLEEAQRPCPDGVKLRRLKSKKLEIKDRISRLMGQRGLAMRAIFR
ncbi:MAG: YdcH family protein [Elstera sp.]